MTQLRLLFAVGALAGAIAAVVYFILANGEDTEWGLVSFAASWGLYLLATTVIPTVHTTHSATVKEA